MKISKKCNLLKEMFPNYNTNEKYSKIQERLMDITMSCTHEEALDQLSYIMNNSLDIIELLAAYDLYESIRNNMLSKYDI